MHASTAAGITHLVEWIANVVNVFNLHVRQSSAVFSVHYVLVKKQSERRHQLQQLLGIHLCFCFQNVCVYDVKMKNGLHFGGEYYSILPFNHLTAVIISFVSVCPWLINVELIYMAKRKRAHRTYNRFGFELHSLFVALCKELHGNQVGNLS